MSRLVLFVRVIFLVCLDLSALVLSVYGTIFLPVELHHMGLGNLTAALVGAALTTVAMMLAPALPIQTLFPNACKRAAVFVGCFPLAACLVSGVNATAGNKLSCNPAFLTAEGLLFLLGIVTGASLASKLRMSNQ